MSEHSLVPALDFNSELTPEQEHRIEKMRAQEAAMIREQQRMVDWCLYDIPTLSKFAEVGVVYSIVIIALWSLSTVIGGIYS